MKFHPGDVVLDAKNRELRLDCRAYMGPFLVWMAAPIIMGRPADDHVVIILEHEIKATQRPEGFQFLLA